MARPRARRRRRLLAGLLCVAAVVGLGSPVAGALGSPVAGAPSGSPARASEVVYVVRAGDTLWSIAKQVVGGDDPRPLVDAIADRNGIDPGRLVPGQALLIPREA